ncbi:MAG TPA: cytochrome c, partial [Methylocystis sp.]|nr:cytochrome c [Methylocystis sp.]
DRGRWASYTQSFAGSQNLLYAGYPWRFSHFHKTDGYANQPLDGIWARSPYLHNGSVPTLRDLLEPAKNRPSVWWRGSDLFDVKKVGYRSDAEAGAELFRFDTSLSGNSNAGHEGAYYGTELSPSDKDALVEYMKTL